MGQAHPGLPARLVEDCAREGPPWLPGERPCAVGRGSTLSPLLCSCRLESLHFWEGAHIFPLRGAPQTPRLP